MLRFEIKYLVPLQLIQRLKGHILQHAAYDAFCSQGCSYLINSTYFDTPDFAFYLDKKDGVRIRKKYRLRTYGKDPTEGVFEIKHKNNNQVSKVRIPLPEKLWRRVLWLREMVERRPETQMIVNSFMAQDLQPTHFIQYDRLAFMGREDPLFRLTLDHDIRTTSDKTHLLLENVAKRPLPGYAILELKPLQPNLPYWCYEMIRDLRLVGGPYSKYAMTLELLGVV